MRKRILIGETRIQKTFIPVLGRDIETSEVWDGANWVFYNPCLKHEMELLFAMIVKLQKKR